LPSTTLTLTAPYPPQLATIATQQLNEQWADPNNKKREEIFKREEEVDSDEEYDRRMEEIERKEQAEREAKEAAARPKSKGRGWGALKKAPVKETLEKVKKVVCAGVLRC
jgi:hypothetical protein